MRSENSKRLPASSENIIRSPFKKPALAQILRKPIPVLT